MGELCAPLGVVTAPFFLGSLLPFLLPIGSCTLVDATGAPASASPPPWAEGQRSKPHMGTTVHATQGLFEVNDTTEAEKPLRPLVVVFNRAQQEVIRNYWHHQLPLVPRAPHEGTVYD